MMTINCNGILLDLTTPRVMGIVNLTPDSFYAESRTQTEEEITRRTLEVSSQGADIIDVGAYSSRSGAEDVTCEEEMRRLRHGLGIIKRLLPNSIVSVDTFRADVAKMCVEEYGVDIINDIAAGGLDDNMFATVASLNVPYIIMHMKGNPRTMQMSQHYNDIIGEVTLYFSEKINKLRDMGVNDIIIDPGFGFSKTTDHNFQLLSRMQELSLFNLPILVGISRKSMIYRTLNISPQQSLNGTTMLNTISLEKGANILRVHDVAECVEVIKLYKKLKTSN